MDLRLCCNPNTSSCAIRLKRLVWRAALTGGCTESRLSFRMKGMRCYRTRLSIKTLIVISCDVLGFSTSLLSRVDVYNMKRVYFVIGGHDLGEFGGSCDDTF